MKIRRSRRDIAQAGYAQDRWLRRRKRMKDPMPLEQVAADIDALVTGCAPKRFELPVSVDLVVRQGRRIAAEPAVEPAAGRQQGPLECGKGFKQSGGVRVASERGAKPADHLRVQLQLADRVFDAAAHDPGVLDQRLRLILKGAEAAFPVEPEAERRIEDGAGIEREVGPVERPVASAPGRTVGAQIMARGTASRIAERKTGVPEQAFAEQNFERDPPAVAPGPATPALRRRRHAAPAAAPGPAGAIRLQRRPQRRRLRDRAPPDAAKSSRWFWLLPGSVFHLRKHDFSDKRRFPGGSRQPVTVSSRLRTILLQL